MADFCFFPAPNPKTESPRAFLPRPLLRAGEKQQKSEAKRKIPIPQKIVFRFAESELKPRRTARILGGQNPEKKNILSILEEKIPRAKIKKARNIFSFWGCRAKRGGGGAFVRAYELSFKPPRARRVRSSSFRF